ncbi:MAG: PAS domain-containing protein [Elusimicrobia bacterium]|nr:PAS domain-containing protein [Elusimicrobiota bacterium]
MSLLDRLPRIVGPGFDAGASARLREELARLRNAQQLPHIGNWSWIVKSDAIGWSDTIFDILGRDRGLPPPSYGEHERLFARESWALLDATLRRILETGEPFELELELARRDGQARWIVARGQTLRDEDGRVGQVHGTIEDISQRKRAEIAWRESDERFRLIAENIGAVFWISDPGRSRVSYVSPSYERIFGRPCAALYENPDDLVEAVVAEDRERVRAARDLQGSGQSVEVEYRITRPDGQLRWLWARSIAVRDGSGNVACHIGMAHDVSERKRAEDEKARLEAQFQQAQKMEAVGLLAGGLAHDFNNVLGTIVGYNYFLLEGLESGHPLRSCALEIKRSSEVAASLTRQFMAVGRNRGAQPRVIDPNSVIMAMGKMLRRIVGENIKIALELHPSLWPVMMDSGQLEQVVLNLAVNARDAMPKGGKLVLATKNLSVSESRGSEASPPGRYVVVEVRDTGVGMDAPTQARLFEPFFTTKDPGRGTGLGLATVRAIVRQYKGAISVRSAPGKGSVFRIRLPRAEGGVQAMLPGVAGKGAKGGHETIMVVEDNDALKGIIKKALREKGYRVFSASSAEEALDLCGNIRERIDLLLTDLVLPDVDGVELAGRMKEARPGLRVAFMSGYPGGALSGLASLNRDSALIEKPFPPEVLLKTLRRLLDAAPEAPSGEAPASDSASA